MHIIDNFLSCHRTFAPLFCISVCEAAHLHSACMFFPLYTGIVISTCSVTGKVVDCRFSYLGASVCPSCIYSVITMNSSVHCIPT